MFYVVRPCLAAKLHAVPAGETKLDTYRCSDRSWAIHQQLESWRKRGRNSDVCSLPSFWKNMTMQKMSTLQVETWYRAGWRDFAWVEVSDFATAGSPLAGPSRSYVCRLPHSSNDDTLILYAKIRQVFAFNNDCHWNSILLTQLFYLFSYISNQLNFKQIGGHVVSISTVNALRWCVCSYRHMQKSWI